MMTAACTSKYSCRTGQASSEGFFLVLVVRVFAKTTKRKKEKEGKREEKGEMEKKEEEKKRLNMILCT